MEWIKWTFIYCAIGIWKQKLISVLQWVLEKFLQFSLYWIKHIIFFCLLFPSDTIYMSNTIYMSENLNNIIMWKFYLYVSVKQYKLHLYWDACLKYNSVINLYRVWSWKPWVLCTIPEELVCGVLLCVHVCVNVANMRPCYCAFF